MDLFVKQRIPNVYAKIQYWNNEHVLYERRKEDYLIWQINTPYSISLIPDYFNFTLANSNSYIVKSFEQTNLGYAIMLENGFAVDAYLKKQFGSNYRNIKKRHLRLETCFNIHYKFIHGDIKEEEYHFLMNSLHVMLTQRFKQRGEINEKLLVWDELLSATISKIREKKASVFVIYDNNVPIDISINYHFHKIMFGAVSSYDIEYSKFGLGSIEKIKLLEWCHANDYKILEFGYGDWEFKRAWSNYVYHFKYEVVYNPNSFRSKSLAKLELLRLSLMEYLKSKKMDVYFNRIKAIKGIGRTKQALEETYPEYETTRVFNLDDYGVLKNVSVEQAGPFPLKSVLNDFLYTNMEHKKDVVMLEVLVQPGIFLLSGKNNIQKIAFRKFGTPVDQLD